MTSRFALTLSFILSFVLSPVDLSAEGTRRRSKLSKSEKVEILSLFTTSKKRFKKNGNLALTYNFESKNEDLVVDWSPALSKMKRRVRWSRGMQGTMSTIEHGIIIADFWMWLHKAQFLPNLTVRADVINLTSHSPGTFVAPIFYNPKKKLAISANNGKPLVCVKGKRQAKRPYPPNSDPIKINNRHWMGFKYDGDLFEGLYGRRTAVDSTKLKKFTEGFDVGGRPGLAWAGSVQCYVFRVTIEGTLDPAWVAKQLGKDSKKSTGTKKKKKRKKKKKKSSDAP